MDQQSWTGSLGNFELASLWLQGCLAHHTSCRPLHTEHWLPTRLLEVGSVGDRTIRLVERTSMTEEAQYVTLSHRRGNGEGCVLTLSTMSMFKEGLHLTEVSDTVRDSVVTTRALGLNYLWIDSMCIIQDDHGDWHQEATTMSQVYGLSTCTIAAANSGIDNTGYLAMRNQYRFRPCGVPNPFKMKSKYSFYIRSQYLSEIYARELKGSLWHNRGWVFQERILSPRLLIFSGTQIMWACQNLQAAETWPRGKTSENYIDRFQSLEVEKARFGQLLSPSQGVTRSNSAWLLFLQDYMKSAKLKFPSDKLVAIQGIATLVQRLTRLRYYGGLWFNDDLPCSLLWSVRTPTKSHPAEYGAPSWSWAAAEGSVNFVVMWATTTLIQVDGHTALPGAGIRADERHQREALHVKGKLIEAAIVTSPQGNLCTRMVTPDYARRVGVTPKEDRRDRLGEAGLCACSTEGQKRGIIMRRLICVAKAFHQLHINPALRLLHVYCLDLVELCMFPVALLFLVFRVPLCYVYGCSRPCWEALFHNLLIFRNRTKVNLMYIHHSIRWIITAFDRAQVNKDALNRRKINEIRTNQVFRDLELGISVSNAETAEDNVTKRTKERIKEGNIKLLSCPLDVYLPGNNVLEVSLLPVVRRNETIFGLLLGLDGAGGRALPRYKRLGMFEIERRELETLSQREDHDEMLLV